MNTGYAVCRVQALTIPDRMSITMTAPVGSALFVGCSVSGVKLQDMLKPMIPLYIALFIALLMVTFIPEISLIIPGMLGFI